MTFQRISVDRNYTIYGPDALTGALLQIDCWSDAPEYQGSYRDAKLLGIAVRQALHGFRGMMGPLRIQETNIESERDLFEAQDHTRRVSFDFRFWYDEDDAAVPQLVNIRNERKPTMASNAIRTQGTIIAHLKTAPVDL